MFRTLSMFSALSTLLLIGAANVGAHQNPAKSKQTPVRKITTSNLSISSRAASAAVANAKG